MPESYSSTAHYNHISRALYEVWEDFIDLRTEVENFKPRPLSDFESIRLPYLTKLINLNRNLNPNFDLDALEKDADMQVMLAHRFQFQEKFLTRPMNVLVSSLFMSQALCESLINLILVLRFHDAGMGGRFDEVQSSEFLAKWVEIPKEFSPDYDFPKSGAIYETLHELVKRRNAYTHYKAEIKIDGVLVHKGLLPPFDNSAKDTLSWIHRFIALPYDLAELAGVLMRQPAYQIILDRRKITSPPQHKTNLKRLRATLK